MRSSVRFLIPILLFSVFLGCKNGTKQDPFIEIRSEVNSPTLVADSIKYEVVVISTSDDPWETERLEGYTHHKVFIESLLRSIYSGKITAYSYSTDEPLTTDEVRVMMEALKPDWSEIGKLLFTEKWYVDSTGMLQKQISSITLGKAEYSKQGTFKGYSALFKVKYN